MCQKFVMSCLACVFLQIGLPKITIAQESFSHKEKELQGEERRQVAVSNLFWQKLEVQKITDTAFCKDTQKTMVCIYSNLNNLALPDGLAISKPVLSTPFVRDIKKHIFSLTSPSPEFCDTSKNTMIVFVATNDSVMLSEMVSLVEQTITPDLILKNIALVSTPLHWQRMKPERCSKKEVHRSKMTTVFIYSDLEKIYLPDGDELIRPTSSIPFSQGIIKHVFNLLYPIPNFIIDNKANKRERYLDVATFVVSNHEASLVKILNTVDSIINPQPVKITISWKEIKSQKYNQNVCESPSVPVIVYSDVENLVFTDNKKVVLPVESFPFRDDIRKHIFCLSSSYGYNNEANYTDSLINVMTFVASKNADRLYSISALTQGIIASIPEEKPIELISETSIEQDYRKNSAETVSYFHNNEQNHQENNIESIDSQIYRIQVSAMKSSSLQAETVQKMYKLPYTVKRFFKNQSYCFMIGEYKSLEEAKKEIREIRTKYKIKDAFIVKELQNNSFVNIMSSL